MKGCIVVKQDWRCGLVLLGMMFLLAACGSDDSGAPPLTPVITAQPADVSVVAGSDAPFSVTATGRSPAYQWQDSLDGGTGWADIPGETATSYSFNNVALSDSGRLFRVLVIAAGATVASSPARLTVTATVEAPAITVEPASRTVTEPATATFNVTATGTALQYQWQLSTDAGTSWADIGSATGASYTTAATQAAGTGAQFRVQVSNTVGSVTSNAATLTINAATSTNAAPSFSTQPGSQSVAIGSTATFSAGVSGTPTPTLQWQRSDNGGTSWTDIASATGSNYTTPATLAGDDGAQFRLIATNSEGSATSDAVTLTVTAAARAPVFTTQPEDTSVAAGSHAHFSVAASGVPAPTFQWQVSTDGGASWSNITGATASTYDTAATLAGDSGRQFRAVASNSEASVNSDAAVLTVSVALTATVRPLDAGNSHTCALKTDGTTACWGTNGFGELGNENTTESHVPATVSGLTGAVALTAGFGHSCALKPDGSVLCWGRNTFGELGNESTTDSTKPVAVSDLTDAAAIAAGDVHTCALKADGTVACWGNNGSGQLGDGTWTERHTPVAVSGLDHAVDIATGSMHSCALKADGTVACWGQGVHGELGDGNAADSKTPVTVFGLSNAVAISVAEGGQHSCALRADHTVVCWGYNQWGQLGDGSSGNNRNTPVAVSGLADAVIISAGGNDSCAIKADGTAVCWGLNSLGGLGKLGNGSTADLSTTPVAVSDLGNAVFIAVGWDHSCALKADGSMVCWGIGDHGELGNDNTTYFVAQIPVAVVGGAVFRK